MINLILRKEIKEGERRTPLTPSGAQILLEQKINIFVEACPSRTFNDDSYESIGCKIVQPSFWKTAPLDHYVLGLKELPDDGTPIIHKHIYFAHIYKNQNHAKRTLARFKKGGGSLYDLEYLTLSSGARVAAFGHFAGFVGAALGLKAYLLKNKLPQLTHFESKASLISDIKALHPPKELKVIIMGGRGRCGKGAHSLLKEFDIECSLWDKEQTKKPGPYQAITECHLFVNCVLVNKQIPPFLDHSILSKSMLLKTIADVSCDPGPKNPIPLYEKETTWREPLHHLEYLSILAVDNLPSLLPRESSEDFSEQLTPHLFNFLKNETRDGPFDKSFQIFKSFLEN